MHKVSLTTPMAFLLPGSKSFKKRRRERKRVELSYIHTCQFLVQHADETLQLFCVSELSCSVRGRGRNLFKKHIQNCLMGFFVIFNSQNYCKQIPRG